MMISKNLLAILMILLLSCAKTYAGWYECYNFKGTIGKDSVLLSIQIREGSVGEGDKKEFNIAGVYKYDKQNNPLKLEGTINFNAYQVLLYEMNKGKQTATLRFDFYKNECSGFRKDLSTNQESALHLSFVSEFSDKNRENNFNNISILQTNSFKEFYFIGVYSKEAGEERAHMDQLKIISKKDNTLFQIIDFSSVESQTGNIKTIIFDNVEITDDKKKEFVVWNDAGRMGGLLTVKFNPKLNKFKLNPNPVPDGPQ
jgi:hypothetical protein